MNVERSGIYEKIPFSIVIIISCLVIAYDLSTIYIFTNFIALTMAIILLGENSLFPFTNQKKVSSWIGLYSTILILVIFINHIIKSDQSNVYMILLTILLTGFLSFTLWFRGWILTIKLF